MINFLIEFFANSASAAGTVLSGKEAAMLICNFLRLFSLQFQIASSPPAALASLFSAKLRSKKTFLQNFAATISSPNLKDHVLIAEFESSLWADFLGK